MADLAAVIGAAPPPEFDLLSAVDRDSLADLVAKAVAARSQLIDNSIEDSLRHIPGMLRGTVKRALGI
jgi:hypothetical protein